MRRREFTALLGVTLAWPLDTRAQQPSGTRRIGYLGTNRGSPLGAAIYRGFLQELRTAGLNEGQNLVVEFRPIEQDMAAISAEANALVRMNVDVIVTDGTEAALQAAVAASPTVPIAMIATNFDPIAGGYVKSLAYPGGNVTGVFLRQTELAEKQTELLTQVVPNGARLAILWDTVSREQFAAAERRAKALNLETHSLKLENPPYDFDAAFRSLAEYSPQMLLVLSSPNFVPSRSHIAALAIGYHLPSMFIFRTYVEAGGLLSYGVDYVAMHRQAATYVVRILAGTKPADLPVEQPTKFELVVNDKTARALGLTVSPSILARADELIE